MPSSYLTPGIYIEEIPGGSRPIQAVGTSTAGFIGEAPLPDAHRGEAVAINNWSQFQKEFIGDSGGSTMLAQGVYGFFLNGGNRCYVVNVGKGGSIAGGGRKRSGLDLLETVDEVAIVAAPGYSDAASHSALIDHCEKMKDRIGILDAPLDVPDIDQLKVVSTVKSGRSPGDEASVPAKGLHPRQSDGGYAAFYVPWITVRNPLADEKTPVEDRTLDVPPSGHIAGVYARNDATRGVHTAPANKSIAGALQCDLSVYGESGAESAGRQLHSHVQPRGDPHLGSADARCRGQRVALHQRAAAVHDD